MIKCDPRAKAKCVLKDFCCGDDVAYFLEGSECDKFNQKVLAPPPTNADHIRSMTDEELGLFLGEWAEKHNAWMCDGLGETLYWLKQPYKEDA